MNMEIWLLLTAVIFTFVGARMSKKTTEDNTHLIIEATIDRLIKDEYIKSKLDKNGEVELLKHYEQQ